MTPRNDFDPTDAALAKLVRSVQPPSHLRRELMALAPARRRPPFTIWLAALASLVVVLAVISTLTRGPSLENAEADLATFLDSDFELSVTGAPLEELQAWLATRDAPPTNALPAELASRIPEGCRIIEWDGRRAALICFPTPEAGVVHLIVFEGGTFSGLASAPRFAKTGTWQVASWTAGGADFLLFGETSPENLRRLL